MARLIDAGELIELIDDDIASLDEDMPREGDSVCRCTLKMVKLYIKSLPTVEAEPIKHGRWLRTDAYPHRIYCSECYATFIRNDELLKLNDIPHDYCSNCGARMDGGEE